MKVGLSTDSRSQYRIQFPDESWAIFCLLDFGSFQKCKSLLDRFPGLTPDIEEEIFEICIINPHLLVDTMHTLKAGTVSTIATAIYQLSGPVSVEQLNYQLDYFRNELSDISYQMIASICRAFPGYTPDILLKMDWQTLVERFVLAEQTLIGVGVWEEPVRIFDENAENKKTAGQARFKDSKHAPIDFEKENASMLGASGYNGHDQDELMLEKERMIKQAQQMYADKLKS